MIDTAVASERNHALLNWYAMARRDLPWRGEADPYLALVSESMLQQTQVDRVIPKFDVFIDRWPTVTDLADADTTELLATWSGLGYNSRALRLKAAARVIHASGWPTSAVELQKLPGVGPYTAAAIASIAFGEDVPAIDTNLKRVLSRWAGKPLTGVILRDIADEALGSPSGDWNQAIMDLGATLCRPRRPQCSECPVSTWCLDSEVYEPPVRQSTFKGSQRELRGALVRAHVHNEDPWNAGRNLGRSDEDIARVLDALQSEGLLENVVTSPRSSPTAPFLGQS